MIELLILSPVLPRSIRFSIGQVDAALAHITEQAPTYNGSEPMPGASTESEARREVGRLHAEFAYQRLDDLLDRGLHASLLDSSAGATASATGSRTSSSPTGR